MQPEFAVFVQCFFLGSVYIFFKEQSEIEAFPAIVAQILGEDCISSLHIFNYGQLQLCLGYAVAAGIPVFTKMTDLVSKTILAIIIPSWAVFIGTIANVLYQINDVKSRHPAYEASQICVSLITKIVFTTILSGALVHMAIRRTHPKVQKHLPLPGC